MYLKALLIAVLFGGPAAAQDFDLPPKETAIPQTTDGIPHVQLGGIQAVPVLSEALLREVETFPGVMLGATRVSLPGATGFQLRADMDLAHPEVIIGGREFAHLHPDGSLHVSLDPEHARAAVEAGWATPHPWASKRSGLAGFVMIYTPQTEEELEVVIRLLRASYSYVTGQFCPANIS